MSALPRPYWLDTGTEICHGCTHSYVYQMEMRCVGCDAGVCEQCVVVESVTRETWCAGCWEKEGASGSTTHGDAPAAPGDASAAPDHEPSEHD